MKHSSAGLRKHSSASLRITIAAALVALAAQSALGATCSELTAALDRAVAARSITAATEAYGDIVSDQFCDDRAPVSLSKLISFLVARADEPGISASERQTAFAAAEEKLTIGGTWQDGALLAESLMRHGERSRALKWYELSLQKQNMPGVAVSDQDRDRLFKKAGYAKILANDDKEGRVNLPFTESTRDEVSGKIGGVFLAPRGAIVVAVPLPVNFYWNETRFTRAGVQALDELAKAAQEQQVRTMRLVGHADPTGAPQYNMDLSRRRVEAVRDALRSRGVHVNFDLAWRGHQEPIDPKNLDFTPTREELYALDRRVEWIRKGATD